MFINQKEKQTTKAKIKHQNSKQSAQLIPSIKQITEIPIDINKAALQIKLSIEGIEVYFPYQPYPQQIDYMKSVIISLNTKKNALLQSPTGTGKTLCLLCASLAWLKYKRAEQLRNIDLIKKEEFDESEIISIIYQSRTHSQLKQVVKELKKTVYQPKLVTLGSRDQYCIKSDFRFMKGSQLNGACKKAIKKDEMENRCTYYTPDWQQEIHEYISRQCLDIEEMKTHFKSHKECPYFVSMSLRKTADIILFPYNYTMQLKMDDFVDLKNNILIYDEAHNISNVAEEGQSFSISQEQLNEAEKQLQDFDIYLMSHTVDIVSSTDMHVSPKEMKTFIEPMLQFRKYLSNIKFPSVSNQYQQEVGIEIDGSQIFEIIKENSKIVDQRTSIEVMLNLSKQNCQWTGGLEKKNLMAYFQVGKAFSDTMVVYGQQAWALEHWLVFIEILSKMKEKDISCYKIYIKQDVSVKSIEFNLWCLDPSIAFQNVLGQQPYSIMLTSGTLEPFDTWPLELKVKFDVQLNNQHVTNVHENVYCRILTLSLNQKQFDFSYNNRQNDQLYLDLGYTIIKMAKQIPNGILAIFCSYGIMEKTRGQWARKENSILLKMADEKPIYWEPKAQSDLPNIMKNYEKDAITQKGAILFGVSRGKVSEGIDFSDELCRCVIMIGIPYPPLQDKRIIMKKQYLDNNGTNQISSKYWYKTQAVRSTNQTIGRVLRHIDDFGCIYLIDQRYQWNDMKTSLSKWLQPIVEVNKDINVLENETKYFFSQHNVQQIKGKDELKNLLSYQKVQENIKENSQGSDYFGISKNLGFSTSFNEKEIENKDNKKTEFKSFYSKIEQEVKNSQKQKVIFKYQGVNDKVQEEINNLRNSLPQFQTKKPEKAQNTLDQYYFKKKEQ